MQTQLSKESLKKKAENTKSLSLRKRFDRLSETKTASIYLFPSLLLILLTIVFPIIYSFVMSLNKVGYKAGLIDFEFVGLNNYLKIFSDPRIPNIISNTIVFTIVSVLGTLIIAFAIALFIHHGIWGSWLFKRLFLIPWALSNVVNALMWQWMYSSSNGIINHILLELHIIEKPVMWLTEQSTAMGAIILADIWKSTPFAALLILAALQSVPKELYDASKVDGAGPFQQFKSIVLPTIKPVLFVVMVTQTMWTLRVFDIISVLTKGGPVDSTMVLNVYAYDQSFRYLDIGYGSALAWLITIITMVITVFYLRVLGKEN
ncbi:carbohydrate ABC transporter permease [Niallia sp. RD1]|uniref:carbohydrate ABC transporter permease n=1 Tax=Niallia sp. RD1 TaxID=2962858 RepID=UPI0020C18BBF|nr:sugar ABC transporter permease [Niallia sp. RD1]UTI40206.1 sugar ABC transporter permease [Niallia sp. RD1]